ncbi:hypothetical protein PIB30_103101 [Stylosanthes scabra]|uniref:Uncharacterized protein n=1 Tax=Stylosanthes scabra TaxID=79078 RepID=A0ABU6YVL6_9FABA|nr:hypothetical protein [Stylosanthes scabra]
MVEQQGYVDETQQFFGSPGGSFFDGVLSPASLEQQFGAEGAYYADLARCLQGSPQGALGRSSSQAQGRTHVDLNQPASDPFLDSSFALGGTPPSAFVDGPSHMDADDQAPPAAADPEPRRGRRAIRRRDVGRGATCSHGCVMHEHLQRFSRINHTQCFLEKQVENVKNMESGNFASGASKAPRICVGITQEPTHMRGIDMTSHA